MLNLKRWGEEIRLIEIKEKWSSPVTPTTVGGGHHRRQPYCRTVVLAVSSVAIFAAVISIAKPSVLLLPPFTRSHSIIVAVAHYHQQRRRLHDSPPWLASFGVVPPIVLTPPPQQHRVPPSLSAIIPFLSPPPHAQLFLSFAILAVISSSLSPFLFLHRERSPPSQGMARAPLPPFSLRHCTPFSSSLIAQLFLSLTRNLPSLSLSVFLSFFFLSPNSLFLSLTEEKRNWFRVS